MALIISATSEKKIIINGTETEIPSVYNRLEYAARIDGITIEIANFLFSNKTFFDNRIPIGVDVPTENIVAVVDIEKGESQSLQAAEKYAKIAYESLGYEVTIDSK